MEAGLVAHQDNESRALMKYNYAKIFISKRMNVNGITQTFADTLQVFQPDI